MSFNDRSSEIVGDGSRIQIQGDGMVRFGSDSSVNVLFYNKQVDDPQLSLQHGRPMKVSRVYVRIQHPGERDYVDDPVDSKPGIQHRFSAQWEKFQKSQEQIPDGTPVEILFPQHLEIAANLHAFGVHTIEQLSTITEAGAMSIGMGVTQWRNQAQDFLAKANAHVGQHQWNREKAVMENTIEVQGNQIAQLRAQLDKVLAQLQGVPGAMVPMGVGSQAQGHAASVTLPKTDWTAPRDPRMTPPYTAAANNAGVAAATDWTAGYAPHPVGADAPFDPYASGLQGAQITPIPAIPPQAPRRPRGRPRKTPDVA